MNAQKKYEKRNESWNKSLAKKEAVKERESFFGRARLANSLTAEDMFDDTETDEIDELDFAMF